MTDLVERLDDPVYHQAVKLPKYNRRTTVFQACTYQDAARVLRRLKPEWTEADHAALAAAHAAEAEVQFANWNRLLDEAAMETFGRPFQFHDYRISAIGRDEFSKESKDKIRFAAHAASAHRTLGHAHRLAARGR